MHKYDREFDHLVEELAHIITSHFPKPRNQDDVIKLVRILCTSASVILLNLSENKYKFEGQ